MIAARRYYGNLSRQQFQMKVNLQLLKKSMYLPDSSVSSAVRVEEEGSEQSSVEGKIYILAFHLGKMHFWAQLCNQISCDELLLWDLKFLSYVMYYNAVVAILPFMVDDICLL